SFSVTLNVVPPATLNYGSATQQVQFLNVGASFSPTVTLLVGGQPQPVGTASFVSRATTVATVDAAGRVTAVGPGQTWVTATSHDIADSIFVIVARSTTGPVLR